MLNKIFVEYEFSKGYYMYLINDKRKIVTPIFAKYAPDCIDFILNNKIKYNIYLIEFSHIRRFLIDIYNELIGKIRVRYKDELREWYRKLPYKYLPVSSFFERELHYKYVNINDFEKLLKIT